MVCDLSRACDPDVGMPVAETISELRLEHAAARIDRYTAACCMPVQLGLHSPCTGLAEAYTLRGASPAAAFELRYSRTFGRPPPYGAATRDHSKRHVGTVQHVIQRILGQTVAGSVATACPNGLSAYIACKLQFSKHTGTAGLYASL